MICPFLDDTCKQKACGIWDHDRRQCCILSLVQDGGIKQ